jgi:hypothetical protein
MSSYYPGVQSFIVVFYNHTGSSWLIETIGSSPSVFIPAFEPLERWAWKTAPENKIAWLRSAFGGPTGSDELALDQWLKELAQAPQFEEGREKRTRYLKKHRPNFRSVGFKMSSAALHNPPEVLESLPGLGTKLILLQRANRVKHALSLYRSNVEKKSQFEYKGERPPSQVDMEQFDFWLYKARIMHETSEKLRANAEVVFARDSLMTLNYEDFVTNREKGRTIKRLTAFLEIDQPQLGASKFQKATPDKIKDAVVNYYELAHHLKRSKYSRDLSDSWWGKSWRQVARSMPRSSQPTR